ncbi:brain-specific serine protease 4-like isoform X2 [Passer domesticus]|uniref:brain-specific serine protease 4-like isoform X2 n=1 Tax=Passer domesticus TaxID=48849 RepID=UPI0030FE867A
MGTPRALLPLPLLLLAALACGRHARGPPPRWVPGALGDGAGSRDPREFSVLLGTRELPPAGEGPPAGGGGEAVALSLLLPHPAYAGEASSGDIALGRLERRVRYRAGLGPVCLPGPGMRFPPGTECASSGWGDTGNGAPRRLRELRLPLLPLGLCRRLYGTDLGPALPPRHIRDDMLCAGTRGGAGTPARVTRGAPWCAPPPRAAGSWPGSSRGGEGCGVPARPGVYTRVSAFSHWIAARAGGVAFVGPRPQSAGSGAPWRPGGLAVAAAVAAVGAGRV